MTLPKKRTRRIVVNDLEFRYLVKAGKRIDETDWVFPLKVTIECQKYKNSILQVSGILTRNWWLDHGDLEDRPSSEYKSIKPSHVKMWIKEAINGGWLIEPSSLRHYIELNEN